MGEREDFRELARTIFEAVAGEFKDLRPSWSEAQGRRRPGAKPRGTDRDAAPERVRLARCSSEDPVPAVDLELHFDPQPGLLFRVTATLQGDELCLSVGDSFFGEWFPCSDNKIASEFQSCFQGVLSGRLRLVEFAHEGRTFKAQLEDHGSGRWKAVATWTTLRWPSSHQSEVRILRNRRSG